MVIGSSLWAHGSSKPSGLSGIGNNYAVLRWARAQTPQLRFYRPYGRSMRVLENSISLRVERHPMTPAANFWWIRCSKTWRVFFCNRPSRGGRVLYSSCTVRAPFQWSLPPKWYAHWFTHFQLRGRKQNTAPEIGGTTLFRMGELSHSESFKDLARAVFRWLQVN